MTIILLLLCTNPYAGNYAGTYRAGFVNPKPITVTIQDEGTTRMTLSSGLVLRGDTLPGGAFDVRTQAGWRWQGVWQWHGDVLVGDFQTGNPLQPGRMWITRQ